MLTLQTEFKEVVRLRDEEELTFEQVGQALGFSERTARRRYYAAILTEADDFDVDSNEHDHEVVLDELDIPEPTSDFLVNDRHAIERFKPITLVGDALLTSDWHIPLHDPQMVNHVIAEAQRTGIKTLVIAGDYFHQDTFSSFLPHQPEAGWPQERWDGNFIMKTLLRTFDHIIITWGNHDFRLVKARGYKQSFTECMKDVLSALSDDEMARITFSDLDYMFYYPTGGSRVIRVCHPDNGSSIPLTVPRKLAMKYGTGVATGHSHHCALGFAYNGLDLIIELGGLFHKERTEYIQKSNTHHEWVQGFIVFQDGVPTVKSPILGNI